MKKIVLLCDSDIICQGVEALLKGSKSFTLIAQCSREEQALHSLTFHRAEILIVAPHLISNISESQLSQDYKETALVALLYHYVPQSVVHKFDGMIEITDNKCRILNTLKNVIEKKQAKQSVSDNTSSTANEGLSEREKEVLVSIAAGLSNKETAAKLNISIFTVISHRRNIIEKTGIKSVAGLTVYALMNNLIDEKDIH